MSAVGVRWLALALALAGCGTLRDDVEPPAVDAGMACANDDPCLCTPCVSSGECASGLSCVTARRKGVDCADGRSVCLAGP